jgi:hypothetical protein
MVSREKNVSPKQLKPNPGPKIMAEQITSLGFPPDYKTNLYYMKGDDVWAYNKQTKERAPVVENTMGGIVDSKKYMYFVKAGKDGNLAIWKKRRGGKRKPKATSACAPTRVQE